MTSRRALKKQIKKDLGTLKKAYRSSHKQQKTSYTQWLYDHYEELDFEVRRAKKGILKTPGLWSADSALPNLFAGFRTQISSGKLPDTDELTEVLQPSHLADRELCELRSALVLCILFEAADALRQKKEESFDAAFHTLSALGDLDFCKITEKLSPIETALLRAYGGFYRSETKETRAILRETLSKRALKQGMSEEQYTAQAVGSAKKSGTSITQVLGLSGTHRALGTVFSLLFYVLPLFFAVLCALYYGRIWLTILFFWPFFELLRPWLFRLAARFVKPAFLPRLSLEEGIPEDGKTVIALCTLMPSEKDAKALGRRLEALFLTNGERNVSVCALADHRCAPSLHLDTDEKNEEVLRSVIDGLNSRYGGGFTALRRDREYSLTQREYAGRERKRGAVEALADVLSGEGIDGVSLYGDTSSAMGAKYLFVADYDTELPNGTIKKLIGTALHPANRASIGKNGRVSGGWGVFAPHIETGVIPAMKTAFSRNLSGGGGLSIYGGCSSEFYMDLFGDSLFQGKGLLDISVYRRVLKDRLPPEAVLSHDMIEGCFLRTAFVSDVTVCDDFPGGTESYFKRQDRWVRGDWQNSLFLFQKKGSACSPNALSKYKLADNLIRSLSPIVLTLCLIAALWGKCVLLIALPLAAFFLEPLLSALFLAFRHPRKIFGRCFSRGGKPALKPLRRACLRFLLLPQEAATNLRAILTAVVRLCTKKKLLTWTVSADCEKKYGLAYIVATYLPSFFSGLALFFFGGILLKVIGLLFFFSFFFSYFLSLPSAHKDPLLSEEKDFLLSEAKRQWRYFEENCTPENHYWPPDSVSENGEVKISDKTSPTNIGFMLLSALAARQLGLTDEKKMYELLSGALTSAERAEKYHGNLYNWYNIRTLQKMEPFYASSVDSGNFLCSLVALKQGLSAYSDKENEAKDLIARIEELLAKTDFSVFYNAPRGLLRTGIDVSAGKGTDSHYDLFMSEMRMTSYYAVASGAVPRVHWSSLGRRTKHCGGYTGILSWTGTMFEYFMSTLFLPAYEGTSVYESLFYALHCQKKFAAKHKIPFGISESAYFSFDENGGYRYKADGVAAAALKKGVGKNLAVSPYSTFLIWPFSPSDAESNLKKLDACGALSDYGRYEAVDFTPERVGEKEYEVIRTCMAHHVGMSFLAIFNRFTENRIRDWFLSDPKMASFRDLLWESME